MRKNESERKDESISARKWKQIKLEAADLGIAPEEHLLQQIEKEMSDLTKKVFHFPYQEPADCRAELGGGKSEHHLWKAGFYLNDTGESGYISAIRKIPCGT